MSGEEEQREESLHPPEGVHRDSQQPYNTQHTTVAGVLKGYDQLLNLVLDEAREFLRGAFLPAAAVPPSRRLAARPRKRKRRRHARAFWLYLLYLPPDTLAHPPLLLNHTQPPRPTTNNDRRRGPLAHHRPHPPPGPGRVPRHRRDGGDADAGVRGGGQPVRRGGGRGLETELLCWPRDGAALFWSL